TKYNAPAGSHGNGKRTRKTKKKGPALLPGPSSPANRNLVDVVVGTVLPDVDLVGRGGGITLLVEGHLIQHGAELVRPDCLLHVAGLERLRLGGSLGPDLDRGIGVEGVALGVIALGLELVDNRLRAGVLARIGVEGH